MPKALASALRLLARRDHGALELLQKLEKNGAPKEEANEALLECQRLGYQCDTRFIESYCRSRIRQGYGPLKIKQELKGKGLDSDLIHQVMRQQSVNWFEHALEVWQKKTRGVVDGSYNELQKHQRFLLYRGFSTDIIAQVIESVNSP